MGIEAGWKNTVLPNNFPGAFLEDNPEADYIIDDFSLALRNKLFYGINTWRDVRTRVYNRLTGMKGGHLLKKYVILFDESEFVPLAKRPTQRKRRENPKYKGKPIVPFSEIEKQEFKISIDSVPKLGPSSFGEYVERMWISGKGIMKKVIAFVQEQVIYHYSTHKPPFEIIIDGCRIDLNNSSPLNGFKINDLRTSYTESQVLHLSRTHGSARISVTDSFGIGESDMKIPRHISLLPESSILVFGDSDTIPIVLLNLRRWICKDTNYLKHRIYLGKEDTKKSSKSVVDLTELWRLMLSYKIDKYGDITNFIEAVVCLMLLTGSDYVQKLLKQFGPVKVWKAFENGGYKFFLGEGAVQSTLEYGFDKIEDRFPVIFFNHKVYDFIHHIYKTRFAGTSNMNSVRRMAREEDRKKKSAHGKYEVASDDELHANIRRIWWNIEYLLNGTTKFPYPDPTEIHDESGLSTHGWVTEMVGEKLDVCVAPKVHTFSKPQER